MKNSPWGQIVFLSFFLSLFSFEPYIRWEIQLWQRQRNRQDIYTYAHHRVREFHMVPLESLFMGGSDSKDSAYGDYLLVFP